MNQVKYNTNMEVMGYHKAIDKKGCRSLQGAAAGRRQGKAARYNVRAERYGAVRARHQPKANGSVHKKVNQRRHEQVVTIDMLAAWMLAIAIITVFAEISKF